MGSEKGKQRSKHSRQRAQHEDTHVQGTVRKSGKSQTGSNVPAANHLSPAQGKENILTKNTTNRVMTWEVKRLERIRSRWKKSDCQAQ